jgi:serine/threonine protein kinase
MPTPPRPASSCGATGSRSAGDGTVEQIGPYRILEKIAAGGMGTVYLAAHERDHGFRKLVAIKQLHPHLEVGEEVKRRFAVEARIGASLAHPNIVSVLDLDTDPSGGLFFVMEYVHGCSLRALTAATPGPLPPPLAAFIVHEIARALHAAHTFVDADGRPWPVIHRDVNPKNVLLSDSGVVKLTDFGIAKIFDQHLTTASGLRGTLGYMSPEQASGRPVDARTDVYSCGVILYELLAGRRAIEGEGQFERLAQAQRGVEIDEAALAAAATPAALSDLLRDALAPDPADRPPSAAALLERLEGYLRRAGYPSAQELAALVAPHIRTLESLAEPTDLSRMTVTAPPREMSPAAALLGRRRLVLGVVAALAAGAALALVLAQTWSRPAVQPPGVTGKKGRPPPADAAGPGGAGEGRLMFATEPRWSAVWIDGVHRGNTPLHITLPAGRHKIVARPLGKGKRYNVTVRIAPGKTTRRVLTVE